MADRARFTLQLIDKVTGGARSAGRSVARVIGGFRSLERGSEGASSALGRATRAASGFGALDVFKGNLLTAAAHKLLSVGEAALGAAGEFITFGQNARLAFGQLAKHGADPEKLFEHSRVLAKRFGLDVIDTTKQYQKFLALQFDPHQVDNLIRMGADLQVLGNSAEDVKGIFTALGQIKSKGKFQAEEMLQLAERGISGQLVTEEIGKILGGKSAAQVQKLQQAGKITADVALQAIEQAINRKLGQTSLGESGAKFADTTIQGFLNRAKALGQDAGLTLVNKLTAPITKKLGAGLDQLVSFLGSAEGSATIDKIASGLETALGFAFEFADAFGSGFMDTIRDVGAAFDPLLKALGGGDGTTAVGTLRLLGTFLGQAAAVAVGAVGVFLGLTAALTGLATIAWGIGKSVVLGLLEPLGKMIGDVILWWDNLSAIWSAQGMSLGEKAWAIGKQIVLGLGNGILAIASYPIDAIEGIATGIVDTIYKIIRPGSPSKVTTKIGESTGMGLAVGQLNTLGAVRSSAQQLAYASYGPLTGSGYGPEVSSLRAGAMFASMPAMASSGGHGRISVTIPQTINGTGDPEETARLSARESRRELEAFFREMNDQ